MSSSTILQPKNSPEPIDRHQRPKIILLVMQVWRNVRAQEREKAANGECLIEPFQDIVVDCMLVFEVGEKRDDRIDRDKKKNANDMPLLVWFQVMCGVEENECEANQCRNAAKDCAQEEAKVVEGEAMPERLFDDHLMAECTVADCHAGNVADWSRSFPTTSPLRARLPRSLFSTLSVSNRCTLLLMCVLGKQCDTLLRIHSLPRRLCALVRALVQLGNSLVFKPSITPVNEIFLQICNSCGMYGIPRLRLSPSKIAIVCGESFC